MKQDFALAACILSCVFAYADEKPPKKVIPAYEQRINFSFLKLGYEHIKPDTFYVGAECSLFEGAGVRSDGQVLVLWKADAVVGYNFSPNPLNTLTPFIGGGYFEIFDFDKKQEVYYYSGLGYKFETFDSYEHLKIGYYSLGLRYEHAFGTIFNLGLNLEGLLGYSLNNKHTSWGNPIYGLDIRLPFTWRFTKKRCWDFRLEPFFTVWFGQNREAFFGGARSTFGYRF